MSKEEEIAQKIAKLEREIERKRIELLLLEGKVDEAFDLMKRIMKRKIIEEWLEGEEKGE